MQQRWHERSRVTFDDDVLTAAKAMATQQHRSVGEVISELARHSLRRPSSSGERNGIPLLSTRPDTPPVTLEIVNAMRDELP
ncbi:CopG family transcriptional regulator [Rhizobium leguminosarum]|uniref:CopG family transcriptional regulator n=1 Tax=Rhizobium TaxID=379 RepID=UPI001441DD51|nr:MULTISPECIES: CopG family transcriptional regulator [Rhizobium]MBY3224806.1 CopG family transcriptional regulator [Rhizobium laguerreae]MBY5446593.1 CopG family transcriptional regulator [Rhizobium leguminosarum]MBY5755892.1 CopG family transcriptional regulator [Rhizobium leguminosarum]MBY5775194.1 CopG family transcriptional regulator [Rhizobium leguminosarum]MBY5780828.1 CopG family transcriptional regulator [Rhizobium leguminosarum]